MAQAHKARSVRACVIGVLLSGTALVSTNALAQTAAATEPVPYWWFHGTVEAGGRFFLNNPTKNGSAYLNQSSLAKYYEYSKNAPGPFGYIDMATGSNDGLYQFNFVGKNIGYGDQSYTLDFSKAGEHYVNLGWDQTPHLYSNSAQTPYNGVGTNALTLPPALLQSLTTAQTANIAPYLHQTDIGIKRDTASVDYRWTPTDAWDVKADYSHLARTGTQIEGVIGLGGTGAGGPSIQVPKPVDDTTQNYGVNGEYAGTSPWGKKLTFKAGYSGSQYTDNYSSYTVQSPFNTAGTPGTTQMSSWPSNNANSFNGTLGADLPLKSRYVGTVSYTMMRQDSAFQPMCISTLCGNNPSGVPWTSTSALPATSLNGAINTTLSNNVVTTQITSELRSKLSYRYYDYQNNTPQIFFNAWKYFDTNANGVPIQSLSVGYTKQDAGEELNWRPSREWNLTAAYGYERYNYKQADVNVTNENSAKLSADWKPASWVTMRTSGYYANRRSDTYDYMDYVKLIQWPGTTTTSGGSFYNPGYRQLMYDNRQRTKANFAIDVVAFRGVTITPNFKYQDDNYGIDTSRVVGGQQGLNDSRSVSGGVDIGYVPSPDLSITVGYLREHYDQSLYGLSGSGLATGRFLTNTSAKTDVDTFTAVANYAAIPDKLNLDLRYMLSRGVDRTQLWINSATVSNGPPASGQFPNDETWLQRLDATAIYKFDPATVSQMGWKGDIKAKFRYTWERNSVANWQNDPLAPFGNAGLTSSIYLASDNPNYNVHMLSASLVASW